MNQTESPHIVDGVTRAAPARIKILPPEEARKIAAGEVVERPASLVREFIDNAIDAGGLTIELNIEEGGMRLIEVSDDGSGMGREDLELAFKTHATSKIRSLADLRSATSLGFRGEALAAACAVSRLEILSSDNGREAWLLSVGPGNEDALIESARRAKGSSVRSRRLFETIPVRKRFLKREGSEALLCKQIFIEKALAFPHINFRFMQDGVMKLFFPAVSGYKERFAAAILSASGGREVVFLHQISAVGQGFSLTIVIGGPEIYRNHRRDQFVFANGRRINDFSLRQAFEYGTQGAFPNGTHPVGAVFLDVDPDLADFNIHPAKREARFICAGAIHHLISETLRNFFRNLLLSKQNNTDSETQSAELFLTQEEDPALRFGESPDQVFPDRNFARIDNRPYTPYTPYSEGKSYPRTVNDLLDGKYDFTPLPGREKPGSPAESQALYAQERDSALNEPHYAGRAFGLFILLEKGDRLYAIDQHAAHERILYERLLSKPIDRQELLVPVPFMTDSKEDDEFLLQEKAKLEKLGIVIAGEDGVWRIEALPVLWRLGDAETVREILNLRTAGENIAERWAATIACHSAIRDGDYLDDESAFSLAQEAMRLPIKTCPHGRPVLMEMKKDDFLKAVRRL
ncbi:MAG: DNA mismatch repair endonuclease MutL [Spirochaetaceae bacterium]|jgi:DNA mismatch repair protein MutL|nr:DNA mismatch repair endonuclease MutL [Spirochaetaceae bacterium]